MTFREAADRESGLCYNIGVQVNLLFDCPKKGASMKQSSNKKSREATAFLYERLSRDDNLKGCTYIIGVGIGHNKNGRLLCFVFDCIISSGNCVPNIFIATLSGRFFSVITQFTISQQNRAIRYISSVRLQVFVLVKKIIRCSIFCILNRIDFITNRGYLNIYLSVNLCIVSATSSPIIGLF